jgi:hypothetical protein
MTNEFNPIVNIKPKKGKRYKMVDPKDKRLLTPEEIELAISECPRYAVADRPGYPGHGTYVSDKDKGLAIAKAQLAKVLNRDRPELSNDIKNCLACAREAIMDAICCEDGLDGGAGEKVIKWITDILGDYDEWIKTHSDKE